jgi:hypothetical protein
MRNRGTVGSFNASHRAGVSRHSRRNFLPQTRRRLVAAQFPSRCPQLQSTVPNSPPAVPHFPTPIPVFPTTFPNAKTAVPILRLAVPNFPTIFPNFSASLPNLRRVFPNFSTANLIYNGLFPSNLCRFSAKSLKKRKDKPSPVLADTLSHPMGEGRGEGLLIPEVTTKH